MPFIMVRVCWCERGEGGKGLGPSEGRWKVEILCGWLLLINYSMLWTCAARNGQELRGVEGPVADSFKLQKRWRWFPLSRVSCQLIKPKLTFGKCICGAVIICTSYSLFNWHGFWPRELGSN